MSKAVPEKRNLFTEFKHEYVQPKEPRLIEVGPAWYLAVDGRGGVPHQTRAVQPAAGQQAAVGVEDMDPVLPGVTSVDDPVAVRALRRILAVAGDPVADVRPRILRRRHDHR